MDNLLDQCQHRRNGTIHHICRIQSFQRSRLQCDRYNTVVIPLLELARSKVRRWLIERSKQQDL
jgi:hypothetical protein